MSRIGLVSFALTVLAACNRPPVGLYETRVIENVPYVTRGDRALLMDIYQPVGLPSLRPAVLLFHGGGWMYGDRTMMRPAAKYLASMGYVSATAQYRLTTDKTVHYPAPIQDALAAVKFLRANAGHYHLDADRIAVGGFSAGGQMALLLGLVKDHTIFKDDSYPGISSVVQAVIDESGPTDLAALYEQGGYLIHVLGDAYLGGQPDKYPERYAEASPISHLRADGPPILILQGDRDQVVPFDQAARLGQALGKVGARSILVRLPGCEHAWCEPFEGRDSLRALPIITHFLAGVFPERPGSHG